MSASDVIRRLQSKLQQISGIHLYMQPVQDITVDDRVSRTQYQYTLEDPDTDELNEWTGKFVAELKKLPDLEDVATDQQMGGARDFAGDRPRDSIASRDCANHNRQHALRCVWPAGNQYAVHADQPISRGVGDGAGVAAESIEAGRSVHSIECIFGSEWCRRSVEFLVVSFGGRRFECTDDVGEIYALFDGVDGSSQRAGENQFRRGIVAEFG